MGTKTKLFRIDESNVNDHYYIAVEDNCFYILEYTRGRAFSYSNTNQLITNFKIPLDQYHRLCHKHKAIDDCADLLANALQDCKNNLASLFVPIPPSKSCDDPEYDDRLVQTLDLASEKLGHKIRYCNLVKQSQNYQASHIAGKDRISKEDLKKLYFIDSNERSKIDLDSINLIVIFDDVLTAGTHFKAVKKCLKTGLRLKEEFPNIEIVGIFLARTINPPEDESELQFSR